MDNIKVRIDPKAAINVNIGGGGGSSPIPPYTGEYTVEPVVDEEVILSTAGKRMINNVTVKRIPLAEVANPAGGETLIIGGYEEWQ